MDTLWPSVISHSPGGSQCDFFPLNWPLSDHSLIDQKTEKMKELSSTLIFFLEIRTRRTR
jgi:hypothetical protein